MARTDFKSVDDYLAVQPEATRAVLAQVRDAIRRALPDAAEVISYQMPAYRGLGGMVIFFAGWKDHYSLYPASDALVAALGDEIAPYRVSKGTIRFPLDQPTPTALIERIAVLRWREAAERVRAKPAGRAPAPPR